MLEISAENVDIRHMAKTKKRVKSGGSDTEIVKTPQIRYKKTEYPEVQESCAQPIEGLFSDMSERIMRIQRDLLMPAFIFKKENIQNTITIFGSAQIKSEEEALRRYRELSAKKSSAPSHRAELEKAKMACEMSKFYTAAEELSRRLQEWSNSLQLAPDKSFYIITGGGPGIMEAANKGAAIAGGKTAGLTITIPSEQHRNKYAANGVWINFNYFLMRKFWLLFFSKAIVAFPGGTGTFDEFFELFTLMKTRKTEHFIPTVLFGKKFWQKAVDFEWLIKTGVIERSDLDFIFFADTVDEAFNYITTLLERGMKKRR